MKRTTCIRRFELSERVNILRARTPIRYHHNEYVVSARLREKVRAVRGVSLAWHFLDDDRRESSEMNSPAGDPSLVFLQEEEEPYDLSRRRIARLNDVSA